MIDLACPNCGRGGSIPREKINTRLVCKKCHIVFHMNTAGRTLLGEPHIETAKADTRAPRDSYQIPSFEGLGNLRGSLPSVSSRSLLLGLAALIVGGGLYLFMARPGESL